MAAVVAVKDEQRVVRAQTVKGRDLRVGRGGVLGQHVDSLGRDDPASAGPRQHAQGSQRVELSAAHVRLSGSSSEDDGSGFAKPRPGGGSSEMLRMVPQRRKQRRALHPSSCSCDRARACKGADIPATPLLALESASPSDREDARSRSRMVCGCWGVEMSIRLAGGFGCHPAAEGLPRVGRTATGLTRSAWRVRPSLHSAVHR
jgi:hypothetical protein